MIYLFVGEETATKDQKIAEIKAKIFSANPEAVNFDFETLDSKDLRPAEFKKSLLALPAVASKRLLIIRTIDKMQAANQAILLEFAKSKTENIVLILDTHENDFSNSFATKLQSHCKLFLFSKGKEENVFDMTRAMESRNSVEALQILARLYSQGNHPLQIMGGLVWFWGKLRVRLSKDKFQSGLQALAEADLGIKRSHLKPEYAVEVAVVKLCSLLAI